MKRLIALIMVAMLLVPAVALASNITGATWYSRIVVSNNSTEADDVFTTFPLGTQNLIDTNFLSENLTDCAIQDGSGTDTAFMPSVNATYPWCLYVDYVGEDAFKNYLLYTGGNADMGGKIRYFPAAGGMTADDDATLELSDNFTIEMSGWIDTDNGTDKNLVFKSGAFSLYVSPTVSENITAAILDLGGSQTETLRPDGHDTCVLPHEVGAACNDHWQNVDEAAADDATTNVATPGSDAAIYTDYYTLEDTAIPSTANISAVTVYIRGFLWTAGKTFFRGDLKLNGNVTAGTPRTDVVWATHSEALARPGGGNWRQSDIDDLLIGVTIQGGAGGDDTAFVTQTYVVVTWQPSVEIVSVTATDVESGEHIVRVTYLPNLLTNSSFEAGDPPTGWTLGAGGPYGRSTTQVKVETYSCNVTRSGADTYVYQGYGGWANYRGREVTLGCWVYATVADRARLRIGSSGTEGDYSTYHSGVAGWEWITVSHTGSATQDRLIIALYVVAGDTTAYFDGAIIVEGDSIPDYNTFRIFIDDVEEDQVYTEAAVPDNGNDWTFVQNYSMPYMEYLKIWKSEIE